MSRTTRDTVALLATAIGIGIGSVSLAFLLAQWGLGQQWFAFVWMTIFVFGIVGWGLPGELERRKRRVYRKFLVWGVFVGLLVVHSLAVGAIIAWWQPEWRFVEWTLVTLAELSVIGFALEVGYRHAIHPPDSRRVSGVSLTQKSN